MLRHAPATRRKERTDALFQSILDEAPMMMWMAHADGSCSFVNRAWLRFTGRTLNQELGAGWLGGVHKEDRAACRERVRRGSAAREPIALTYRFLRADGEYRWVINHAAPRATGPGVSRGYVGSCLDATENVESERELAAAELRWRRLIEHAADMVYRYRLYPTRKTEYVSPAARNITGHAPEEFYADPDLQLKVVHPDDVHILTETLQDPARLQTRIVLRWPHADGRIVWSEHRRVPVFDGQGRLVAIDGIARDVTRHRAAEDQMRQLAARLQAAREDERTELARELHDDLGQTLTAIKLELARATTRVRNRRPVVDMDRFQSLVGLVDVGLVTVKRITTNLRPPVLDLQGLAEAIRSEAGAFRARTGIRCRVMSDRTVVTLDGDQQTALFRIFQEALTNVVRHAHASAVLVTLTHRRRLFELKIQDNGRGATDNELADPKSIGLLGMRERATAAGATFHIAGRRGRGTSVTVQVPLAARRRGRPVPQRLESGE